MTEQMSSPPSPTGSSEQKPPSDGERESSRGPSRFLEACLRTCGRLLKEGNRRQFLLRNAGGRTVLHLPLTVTALIALFLLWRAPVLLILAILIALAMRMQAIISREEGTEESNNANNISA